MAPVIIKTSTPDSSNGTGLNAYPLDLGAGTADVLPGVLIDPDALKPIGSGAGSVGLPIAGPADLTVTGTLTLLNDSLAIPLAGHRSVGGIVVSTNPSGADQFVAEISVDGAHWVTVPLLDYANNVWSGILVPSSVASAFAVTTQPAATLRLRYSLRPGAGGPYTVTLLASAAPITYAAVAKINSQNWFPSFINQFLKFSDLTLSPGYVSNTPPANSAVLGVVTRPYPPGDGTNAQALKGASTAAAAADPAAVVALSPNSDLLYAPIDVAALGDNTIVAADATRKIKLVSYTIVADAAVAVRWKDSTPTNLSGAMSLAANGVLSAGGLPHSRLLETATAKGLVLNLSAAVGARGHCAYRLEL